MYAAVLRFSSLQKNMPRATVDAPDARKLGIGSPPVIPAGTMIPARGVHSDRGRVRAARPRYAGVRQCTPISAAVHRNREIDSPPEKHQEVRADGAGGWIRRGIAVRDSDSRGAAAALALPFQNRKTYISSGVHRRTLAYIGVHPTQIWELGKKVWCRKKLFQTSSHHQVPVNRTQYQIDRESLPGGFPVRRAGHL